MGRTRRVVEEMIEEGKATLWELGQWSERVKDDPEKLEQARTALRETSATLHVLYEIEERAEGEEDD